MPGSNTGALALLSLTREERLGSTIQVNSYRKSAEGFGGSHKKPTAMTRSPHTTSKKMTTLGGDYTETMRHTHTSLRTGPELDMNKFGFGSPSRTYTRWRDVL
jgi:hypothetical protein